MTGGSPAGETAARALPTGIEAEYAAAADEWVAGGDADVWTPVVGDGLDPPVVPPGRPQDPGPDRPATG